MVRFDESRSDWPAAFVLLPTLGQHAFFVSSHVCLSSKPTHQIQSRRTQASCSSRKVVMESRDPKPTYTLATFLQGWDQSTDALTSLKVGSGFLALLFIHRLFVGNDHVTGLESRSDILGIACAVTLVLYAFAAKQVNIKQEQEVELVGSFVNDANSKTLGAAGRSLEWCAKTLCRVTNVQTFVLVYKGRTLFRYGVMGPQSNVAVSADTIAQAIKSEKKTYYARLEILPAKDQLAFLPENCQAALIQPIRSELTLFLGANKIRPFTTVDFGWIQAICSLIERVDLNKISSS
eukprot:CAMPEP_0184708090 /NCGR_PEP_ID=MMETSP0313-20130426/37598_1 /TAXON_ID=2792 /ORGANISM="Porphyridium aerugineum, Strain SAG 1380-2" /LENGTH=291 /DNA_ID=CAMNT_0027169671 /DNA_START=52 /DNA_END=927 /DNA_ORIENTATION=+